MSCALSTRCLRRAVASHPPAPVNHVSHSSSVRRQYSYAALKTRSQPTHARQKDTPTPGPAATHQLDIRIQRDSFTGHPRERKSSRRRSSQDGVVTTVAERGFLEERVQRGGPSQPDQIFSDHLSGLFSPLKFPPQLSARILTHASHPAAFHGHNAQLSFIGRRVLESYLLLLLTSSSHLKPTHDLQEIVSRVLNTYFLGEHIGSKWGLGRVMRWTPTLPASLQPPETLQAKSKLLKEVGLFKVQGDAVTAVIGGIFQQFGASVAHRVFHTRMLPRLLLTEGGLPACFHGDANAICARLGGANGDLILDSEVLPSRELQPEDSGTTNSQQTL
ncbi:RNase III domain-containing protein [Mycena indigotica]|uniref:RNase III domain-containing protein n=1 Tax=Mycena indigotica TaxID=2126181 RepID=A0A8H6VVN1_9AGAR|nr:RNase III domain-containing protein [Mycena indigotica]KAF7289944.1 RNase III domain-containing protein [Mycena indigotica]